MREICSLGSGEGRGRMTGPRLLDIFDLDGNGRLNRIDLDLFRDQWQQGVGKPLARRDQPASDGVLDLEIARVDDGTVELLLRLDGAHVLGYGASLRYDADAFRIKSITDERARSTPSPPETLLNLDSSGEVLLIGGTLEAPVDGALARIEFERLSPDVAGTFRIAEAALRSSDGAVVQPLRLGGAEIRPTPQVFALDRNYPNPFNPSTTIPYRLATTSAVQLDIFDIAGRKVRTVLAERQEAGFRQATWDGRDERGVTVGAGVYLYRLTARPYQQDGSDVTPREFVEVRKLMLLK